MNWNMITEMKLFTSQIISKLGKIIFEALDYGLSEEDERQLSPELDELLDTMISAGKV